MIKVNKFFILYIILLFLIGFHGDYYAAFCMVMLHELTHYLTAKHYKITGVEVEILPFGAFLKLKELDEASPKEDFIISMSGPLFNFIMALIFYVLYFYFKNEILYSFSVTNAALCIFNLIPALPLDGGRILRALLSTKMLYKTANLITVIISMTFGFLLMFIYFITFLKYKTNLSVGFVSIYIIVCSYKEKERFAYLIMSDIIKKRFKIIKRGYIENKSFSIYYKQDLLSAIGVSEKNKYNVFTILNEELKVLDIIYEGEILEGLKKYGNITLEQYIKLRETEK